MSRYTMHIAVYTYNDILHFRVIFQCLYIHAYLSHADDIRVVIASELKKLYAHFGFVLTLFIHGIYLYIPVYTMYIVLCHMFSHSPGQVSYFLVVGQCVDVCSCQHTYSMHSTAYPAAKSEKNMFAGNRLCI